MITNMGDFHEGQVKFYNIVKGFGFVRDLDTADEYFVHATSIPYDSEHGKSRILHDGEYIRFTVGDGDKGKQCFNVTGLRGGTLLCDHNKAGRPRKPRNNVPVEQ